MENNTSDSVTNQKRESLVFKFVILGDSNVGKTSILYHYIFGKCKRIINISSSQKNSATHCRRRILK